MSGAQKVLQGTADIAANGRVDRNVRARLIRRMNMKITEWWLALVWAACMWAGSALTSEQGFKTPVGFGMFVGCACGALLMRWNIKRSNAEVSR